MQERVAATLLRLSGGDPFADVLAAAEAHRPGHGEACGLFPAGPHVMRLAAMLAAAAAPRRIVDLGTGFGYSALWLATAAPQASVVAVDQFPEHVEEARRLAAGHGVADRISFVAGEAAEVVADLEGPVDLVHDDAWFAAAPPYLEQVLALLRPGGVLTMPNWFLLEDALTGTPRRDWSELAGAAWAEDVQAYAERLAADPRLSLTWVVSPPLGIAVRR